MTIIAKGRRNFDKQLQFGRKGDDIYEPIKQAAVTYKTQQDKKNPFAGVYSAFSGRLVKKILNLFGAKEWDPIPVQDGIVDNIRKLREHLGPKLLGFRFSYITKGVPHSVGIRNADIKDKIKRKDKHWLYIQSWKSVPPLAFTDDELVTYLKEATVEWDNHQRVIRPIVLIRGAQRIFRAPIISNSDHEKKDIILYRYWKCIEKKKNNIIYMDHSQIQIEDDCNKEATTAVKSAENDLSHLAYSEYENDYSEYYDDYDDYDDDASLLFDVISQYHHNMEMKEKRVINKLNHELDLENSRVKALLRKYKIYKKMHY